MSDNFSRIKNLYFPISDYHFKHGPSDKEKENTMFLGRTKALLKLEQLLTPDSNEKSTNKGTYLVAGYRGMGKTSVVRQAVVKINKSEENASKEVNPPKSKKVESFEIYLSQNEIKDEDILRQVAAKLIGFVNDAKDNKVVKKSWIFRISAAIVQFIFGNSNYRNLNSDKPVNLHFKKNIWQELNSYLEEKNSFDYVDEPKSRSSFIQYGIFLLIVFLNLLFVYNNNEGKEYSLCLWSSEISIGDRFTNFIEFISTFFKYFYTQKGTEFYIYIAVISSFIIGLYELI